MSRWEELTGGTSGEGYAARFAALADSGKDVHGEARLCAALAPPGARVLDAGCGTGRVMIRLAELGYDCVGVDLDASMLAVARRQAPELPWIQADLATFDPAGLDGGADFDLAVAAGNIFPLLAAGTEAATVARLAAALRPGGLLVAGFGLDADHLPVPPTITLSDYDAYCAEAGLTLVDRFATWDAHRYEGGGYAVSVHRAPDA
ncbi:dTDP-3-amino-3,6-dideoxy-alpha-D-glucopyranose N,N-dimethyltransferase [Streptomyces sp. YIM 130001]|uniref:class I SAM-dependent methyltransferase n=1 Tax=Streptomyces sp. YIM 130001 TaxID=2259644 RepID=UPI000E650F9F|nr:class I SAM-dependent methyltransferase [Streptomyces sp. YIM 130001]RII20519.1 dTDP-3-amino-3,6-dideoxy-alpha-D-glucopyranose N,N-dimethyltransferase [Streptomyces sp. YIM 130001]